MSATDISLRPRNLPPGYTWGQGFHTRGADGIFYCEVVSAKPDREGLVLIRSRPDLGRNTKSIASVEAVIEAAYLFPLLRGQNVDAFSARDSGLFCIVPHDPVKLTRVLSVGEVLQEAPHLFDYLEPHIDRLENRSAYDLGITSSKPWGIQGTAWKHLLPQGQMVVTRYMHSTTHPPAAVSTAATRELLGRKTTVYPNNKLNFVSVNTVAEADYLATMVNATAIQGAIARQCSSTTIAPSAMNSLPIPKFDFDDSTHVSICEIGRRCRLDPQIWDDLELEADQLARTVAARYTEAAPK